MNGVSASEIRRIYADLGEDVSAREDRLREDLPIGTTAGVHAHLDRVVDDWEAGRKSLRTVPVCDVYARHLGRPLEDSMTRLLVGLDAAVNVLDDIIDTPDLSPEARVALTVNAAFSAVLIAENCPRDARDAVRDRLRDYFTALFQVPMVERRLLASMRAAANRTEALSAAEQVYAYRARDIDAFARVPASVSRLDPDVERRLLGDLRAYRARRLLFKDIRDVERDLADGDATPVIHLLRRHDDAGGAADAVLNLYGRFSYSERGRGAYGDALRSAEDPPDDLRAALSDSREAVAASDAP